MYKSDKLLRFWSWAGVGAGSGSGAGPSSEIMSCLAIEELAATGAATKTVALNTHEMTTAKHVAIIISMISPRNDLIGMM